MLHARGGGALLDEAGVVNDQDSVAPPEAFGDVVLELVTDLVRVPAGTGEQVLQPVGGGVTGVLGQLPAIFAADRAEQASDVAAHPAAWLHAPEAVADTEEEVFEFVVPGLGRRLVDHDERLPRRCHYQRRLHTIEGRFHEDRP